MIRDKRHLSPSLSVSLIGFLPDCVQVRRDVGKEVER